MWVLVGVFAGWLAGLVMKPGGFGLRWDIILGLVGSIVGSGFFWALSGSPDAGLGAVAVVALAGFAAAAALIILQRKMWPAAA
jgi:uncharacterized membrane protein YeaQ/YmgE (transglycosylase-associated protein family)